MVIAAVADVVVLVDCFLADAVDVPAHLLLSW